MNDRKREMKKLEDIEKKNIYTTPEGYFDQLPDKIQSRIQNQDQKRRQIWMNPALRYAAAAAIILLVGWFGIFRMSTINEPADYNQLLTEVSTAELVAYIESSDLTADEILDEINLDEQSFDKVFKSEQDFLDDLYMEEELLIEIDEFI